LVSVIFAFANFDSNIKLLHTAKQHFFARSYISFVGASNIGALVFKEKWRRV